MHLATKIVFMQEWLYLAKTLISEGSGICGILECFVSVSRSQLCQSLAFRRSRAVEGCLRWNNTLILYTSALDSCSRRLTSGLRNRRPAPLIGGRLVAEVAHSGGHHRDAGLVCSINDLLVADGAARLYHGSDAAFCSQL